MMTIVLSANINSNFQQKPLTYDSYIVLQCNYPSDAEKTTFFLSLY
jgi:hypothetical protein